MGVRLSSLAPKSPTTRQGKATKTYTANQGATEKQSEVLYIKHKGNRIIYKKKT